MPMSKNGRLFYLWCVFIGGILLVSILPASSWIYRSIAGFDSNRWVHFLAYALAASIPVAAWKRRKNILLSLIPVLMSTALEAVQAAISEPIVRTQNVPADLFGIAAGILLGLNIRTMRKTAKSPVSLNSDASRPAT